MTTPLRTVYAQSSSLHSRTWPQYRLDMKKKAIAELEFLPFLRQVLAEQHQDDSLRVEKHGGDALLWFDANSVSQDPDYRAVWGKDNTFLYEFQLAEDTAKLNFFDFKVSKVGKKVRGADTRTPHAGRQFFYILKDREQYALISPQWIAENGRIGGVPAWGNRTAYRVPRDVFLKQFRSGGPDLAETIKVVDDKICILDFQAQFLEQENQQLARELQQVVDEEKLLSIVPRTLDGFYRVCYLLDKIGKRPDAPGVWLVYLASFFTDAMRAADFVRYIYALDFVYFNRSDDLQENEQLALQRAIEQAISYISRRANSDTGALAIDPQEAPLEETRQILFAANLIEDIKQDAAVKLDMKLATAGKIFELIPDAAKTAGYIRAALNS